MHPATDHGFTPPDGSPPPASTGTLSFGMPVREVLKGDALAGSEVLAGRSGLDRVVCRLNVMEVPDILAWVKPHELLITTGYPLRHTPQTLGRLVDDLDERGLAALGVKLGRYLDELPAEMVDQANRRGFPLIRLPDGVAFDDILNQVLTDILNRQAATLARAEEVHRALVHIVLGGGGLNEVTGELAGLLDLAVAATNTEGVVLAEAGDTVLIHQLRRTLGGAGGRRVQVTADRWQVAEVPVVAGGFNHGRLLACGPAGSLGEAEIELLERAATVAALVITKQQAVAAVESKYRGDFLRDVLAGRAGNDDKAIAHGASFGWDLSRPAAVLVADVDVDTDPGATDTSAAHDRLAVAWQSVLRRRDPKAAVAGFAQEVVAVVAAPQRAGLHDFQALVKEVATVFEQGVRGTFATGISRTVATPGDLPAAYEQALKAVRVGRQLTGGGAVAHFDELGVYRLLSLVPDSQELRSFVSETLGDLADDDEEAGDLRRTLETLLETNLNVAETARRLHFHYNTLRYRIGKLERKLGPFTEDAHLRLNLILALHVLRMRGVYGR